MDGTVRCPQCGLTQIAARKCKSCGTILGGGARQDGERNAGAVSAVPTQGAVIGGWVCLAVGAGLMLWTLLSFFLYLPLFLAAFALGIVAIAQRWLLNGILVLLLSVSLPLGLGLGLSAYRAARLVQKVEQASAPRQTLPAVVVPATPTPEKEAAATGSSPEQMYIQQYLEVYDLKAAYMNAVVGGRIPGVVFKLKNNGERIVDEIKVVVFFRNATGSVIAEQEYLPVYGRELGLSGGGNSLKPGYIWQMEQGKFFKAGSVPNEWQEGLAEARITQIRFAKADSKE